MSFRNTDVETLKVLAHEAECAKDGHEPCEFCKDVELTEDDIATLTLEKRIEEAEQAMRSEEESLED